MLTSDYSQIPVATMQGLSRYAEVHQPTGGFLQAVLANDLAGAFARADDDNRAVLWEIVSYCHWQIPADCWGSAEKVQNWLHDWEPVQVDLDTIDVDHDLGIKWLTDPWER